MDKTIVRQDLVEKLTSDEITKKEYDEIIALIAERVNEIWRFICEVSNRKLDWWAFQNDLSLGNGNGSTGGEFDPENDADEITIEGLNKYWHNPYYAYNEGFPTRFLWEDYRTEVTQHVASCKERVEADKVKKIKIDKKAKEEKDRLVKSIQAKLTPEELKIVKFV